MNRVADRPIVIWELTRACRAACRHCPAGAQVARNDGELSTYEAFKTLDQIVALGGDLVFTGGDPFERRDLYDLVNYARRRGLSPALEVSGTWRLSEAAVRKLARFGLHRLILGLDASQPLEHERVRGSVATFTTTLLAARWAHLANVQLEVNTLATPDTLRNFTSLSELLEDIAVDGWNVWFLVPVGGSKDVPILTAGETEDLFALLHDLRERAAFAVRVFEAPHFSRYELQHGASIADLAPRPSLFISHLGEVMPGPFQRITVGNVRYDSLSAIHFGSEILAVLRDPLQSGGKCGHCEYREVCGGSRARAQAMTGDPFAADPLCAYQPAESLSQQLEGLVPVVGPHC